MGRTVVWETLRHDRGGVARRDSGLGSLQQDVGENTSFLRWTDQTLVQSLVRKVEPIGIESCLVQDGSLQIADTDWVFDWIITDIVGLSVHARFDSATSHPHRECMWMMIATNVALHKFLVDVVLSIRLVLCMLPPF